MSGVVLLQRPSPNYNKRPRGVEINTIVLHADSAPAVKSSINWCRTPGNKLPKGYKPVSYHVIVGRLGDAYQLVDFEDRAWHSGVSSFMGRDDLNNYSIGLAFGNKQDGEPFKEAAYQTMAALIRELMLRYPAITRERITLHSVVAPGRKFDPDKNQSRFDMDYLMSLI
jgi:AmpD protein